MLHNCKFVVRTAECFRIEQKWDKLSGKVFADLFERLIALQVFLNIKNCDALL